MSIWQANRTLEDVERGLDIEKAINRLSGKEAKIVKDYYGLGGGPRLKLREIAADSAVTGGFKSTTRARYVLSRALLKLRRPSSGLRHYRADIEYPIRTRGDPEEKNQHVEIPPQIIIGEHSRWEQRERAMEERKRLFFHQAQEAIWGCPMFQASRMANLFEREKQILAGMAERRRRVNETWDRYQSSLAK